MYPVNSNFHSLSTQDAPKTRTRIYFIDDTVDCTNDTDVQTNGTLLVWAAGDTDSNGRVGDDGIRWQEYFNRDKNIEIGAAVSSQIEIPLINMDGALNNFSFGRCKVYLDVYDTANSTWRVCPMGVYIIDLPTKRRVKLISASGYDQMQLLDAICDSWWSGLNWSGGITLSALLTSMANQLGVKVSTATASAILNSSVSYTEAPFACVEVTYREVLEYIAEATGTIARFDRDGYLDLRFFSAAKIGGNTVTINADTVGNTCLDIDIAEYQAAAIDLLKVKIAEDDIGVTVGSGTNQYTIVNNLFLYGSTATIITNRATPIYNRLNGLGAYTPIQAKLIYDWSLEAGDIINIVRDSTTYPVLIFQQTLSWRGGYVTADILADGDNVRPVMDYDERASYRMYSEMSKKVGENEIISKINQTAESIQIQASRVDLAGYVTFTNLSTSGQTTINGGNITTGTIDASTVTVSNINASNISSGTLSAARIGAGSITANKLDSADINASKILTVGSMTDAAAATVLNSNIAIGGRNLCTGTAVSNEFTKSTSGDWFVPIGAWPISTYGGTAFADTANTQWTASFDYSITGVDVAFTLRISIKTSASSYSGGINVASIPVGSSSGHAEGTGTITDGARDFAGTSGVLFTGMADTNTNAVLTVSNLKLEIGNKATSWTQAPEDVAADIATAQTTADSANSQEQLIYISKASGTTTQSATTTWVTNATGNQNTWTIKRPTYNSSYPVLFVATQRKSVGGTVTCTTPQIDNTTTVIDGGHITTGTIDASVVSVTNLNASNITSGTMSASKINGGDLVLGGNNNTNGTMTVKDANGNTAATVNNNGITINGSTSKTVLDGGLVKIQNASAAAQNVSLEYVPISGTNPAGYIQKMYTPSSEARTVSEGFWWYIGNKPVAEIYSAGDSVANCDEFVGLGVGWTPISGSAKFVVDKLRSSDIEAKNLSVYGVLDVTNRRCYAELSSEGWYRVCQFDFATLGEAIGAAGGILHLSITDSYGTNANDSHTIDLLFAHNKITFANETSAGNYLGVDKIRYTFNSSSPYDGFVDIHWVGGSSIVGVTFDYDCIALARQAKLTAMGLVGVAASPADETVLTTYTFAANTEANGSATAGSGVTINEMDIKRSGRIVYVHFYATGTFAANTSYTLGTLSGVPMPTKHIRWMAGGGGNAYNATTPVYAILDYTNSKITAYASAACNAINITVSYIV